MMSMKLHFSMLDSEVLKKKGYEYLVLLSYAQRSRALECLGQFPALSELREYVRACDEDVDILLEGNCRKYMVVMVDDCAKFVLASSAVHGDDLWQFWVELFFLSYELLQPDEYDLLACTVGDPHPGKYLSYHGNEMSEPLIEYVVEKSLDKVEVVGLNGMDAKAKAVQCADVVVHEPVLARYGTSISELKSNLVAVQREAITADLGDNSDGYCYDKLFPPPFKGLVRKWLGKNPGIHDVVDLLLVFRRLDVLSSCDTSYALEHTDTGRLHVNVGKSNPFGVLYDMVVLCNQGYSGVVGTSDFQDEHAIDHFGTRNRRKEFCEVCKFEVNMDGHSTRCRVGTVDDHAYKLLLRRRAWLGDDRQRMDVRQVILSSLLPVEMYEPQAQKYTERSSQARWYRAYTGYKMPPLGSSDTALATAFEASYVGKFREDYFEYLLGEFSDLKFPRELIDQIVDDRSKLIQPVEASGILRTKAGYMADV